jgi:CspA family cold shock protein
MQTKNHKNESQGSLENIRPRLKGNVVWFDGVKGFGFIKPSDPTVNEGKDLFIHFHHIVQRGGGYKSLKKGDEVEFFLGQNDKGPCASEVKITKPVETQEGSTEATP